MLNVASDDTAPVVSSLNTTCPTVPTATAALGSVPDVTEAPLITGAALKVFAPENVCVSPNNATFVLAVNSGIVKI